MSDTDVPQAASAITAAAAPQPHDPTPQKSVNEPKLPRAFTLRWSTRAVSFAVDMVVLMQLTFYATDAVGLPAGLVGGLFLAAKIFDGFTYLFAGFLIDRTRSRWGRARPYDLFIVPAWVLTIAIFSTPDMSQFWQATYLFVLYALINSVCMTFLNGSDGAYLKRSLTGEVNYAKVLSRNGVIVILVSAVASVMLPQLMATWGTEPGGWTKIALVYGVPMMIIGVVRFLTVKELPEEQTGVVETAPVNFKVAVRAVARNKFVFVLSGLVLLANVITNMGTIVGAYYFKYILGDLGLLSLAALGAIVLPFVFLLFPLAVRTVGATNFLRGGLVIAMIGFSLIWLFPNNVAAVVVGQILGTFTSIVTLLISFFVIQTMIYSEWKSGHRVDAVTNSVTNFATKLGSGVASALVGVVLGIVGYNGLADVQTDAANDAIVSLFSLVPLAFTALMLVLTFFYKLDKHTARLRDEVAHGMTAESSDLKL